MKEGATDFLTKPVAKETLLEAVENAVSLDVDRRAARRRLKTWQESFRMLTPRERQVFDGVVAGKLNKQIAAELCISIKTVEKHRQQLMNKLNIHEVAGLTRYALSKGIVERAPNLNLQ